MKNKREMNIKTEIGIDLKNENLFALILAFLISIIFLHPIFFGKVDIPVDIRDVSLYPWRYHAVDEKLKTTILWKIDDVKELKIAPGAQGSLQEKIDFISPSELQPLKDKINISIKFHFRINSPNKESINFGVSLLNTKTLQAYNPIVPISQVVDKDFYSDNDSKWLESKININDLFLTLNSVDDLKQFQLVLTALNSSEKPISIFVKDLELRFDDFSNALSIHNYFPEDLIIWFTPARELFSKALKNGKLPYWTNSILGGAELVSEPQVGFFHPLYILSYFLFDHFTAHILIILISLVVSGLGAFMLCRFWGLSLPASILGLIVYIFHPFNVSWFSFEHIQMVSAVLPFLILFYEKNLLEDKLINKYLIGATLLFGLIFLSGHLQVVYYTAVFFYFFWTFKLILEIQSANQNYKKHIFGLIFISLFTLGIASIVLIPFFPQLFSSHRTAFPLEYIKNNAVKFEALNTLIFPYYKGAPVWTLSEIALDPGYIKYRNSLLTNYLYFGFLPFVLSFFSLRTIHKDRKIIFFYLVIFISFLVFMASDIFLAIKPFIPGLSQMQNHRFTQVYSFCVPFLAAIGFNNAISQISKGKLKNILIVSILLITVFDLMYFSSFFVTWSKRSEYNPVHPNGGIQFLQNKVKESSLPFRVLPVINPYTITSKLKYNTSKPNSLQTYGIEELSGYSSFINKDIYSIFLFAETGSVDKLYTDEIPTIFRNVNIPYPIINYLLPMFDTLNVRYFIAPPDYHLDPKVADLVYEGDCNIYENKNFTPRAFLSSKFKVLPTKQEIIKTLNDKNFNPLEEILLTGVDDKLLNELSILKSEMINYDLMMNKYSDDSIALNISTDAPAVLVLGNNLNENWEAKINNEKTEFFPVNLIQRGILIPHQGTYTVEFSYNPLKFKVGFAIALLSIAALFLVWFFREKINRS